MIPLLDKGAPMFTIESKFVGSFKLGDNINHNLDILALLYGYYAAADERGKRLLCKPIILLLVSIIEAALHDLHMRIRTFTIEGVKNVGHSVSNYVRGKQIDELEKYIASARKHDLFDLADTRFYEALDELRKLRNRIHIQNKKGDFEPDEYNAFNDERKVLAERALEKTLRTMAAKFPREQDHVREFTLPWNAHFA